MGLGGDGVGGMRFRDSRATFLASQALMRLGVIGALACGRERPTEPLAAPSPEAADTVAVMRAVATTITETNARAEGARAAQTYPANCRGPGLLCWKIEIKGWHVSPTDRVATILTDLLGVPIVKQSPAVAPPACPWPTQASGTGFRTAISLRFMTRDLAEVAVSRRCVVSGRRELRHFLSHEVFEVRRAGAAWEATITEVGVT